MEISLRGAPSLDRFQVQARADASQTRDDDTIPGDAHRFDPITRTIGDRSSRHVLLRSDKSGDDRARFERSFDPSLHAVSRQCTNLNPPPVWSDLLP